MAVNYKVLGQSAPSASTATTLYSVPAATQAVISTITACNRASSTGTIRVAVRPDGAALADQHYLVYDSPLEANATVAFTLGVTVDASDVVEVYASSASFSFNAFGSEVS